MDENINRIRESGYCVVPQVYDEHSVHKALDVVRDLAAGPKRYNPADLPPLGRDALITWNLQYKHPYFLELLFASPEIERILIRLLNDTWYRPIPQDEPNYILRTYVARSSRDSLPLHVDSFFAYAGDAVISMQYAIILEDMDEMNGATLVVPGSHTSGQYAEQSALQDAIAVEARAGDVVLLDSRIWHGATENRSGRTRWSLWATFNRWWIKQSFRITQKLPQDIYATLTDKQKAVMGFCSIPYGDESEGIDMRVGYESLEERVSSYWSSDG